MNLLISAHADPYLNLAIEEYLLKNSHEEFIFLYVNRPCVVVGKHQITQKEINSNFTFSNKIAVARRLSGGGTVYHDEGNLNFSYIQTTTPGETISYPHITQSIFGYLKTILPELELTERNDFLLQGKKISGSAMHIFKNRLIAHGTLLINCNLGNLSSALKVNQERFKDKSISSIKSEVMNISSASNSLNINTVINDLTLYLRATMPISLYQLPSEASETIQDLALTKYAGNNWIFGYSPKYTYTNHFYFKKGKVQYRLEIVKGMIENVIIEQPDYLSRANKLIMNGLVGKEHNIFYFHNNASNRNMCTFELLLLDSLF